MKRIFWVFIQLTVLFLCSNCATILNGKYQTVYLEKGDSDCEVYVDSDKVSKGKTAEAVLERDLQVRQVRTELEGYKPEYSTIYQVKPSPLKILSFIPFGILIYPPFYDKGAKSYNYDKEISVASPSTSVRTRQANEKYIFLEKTAMELDKENLTVEGYMAPSRSGRRPTDPFYSHTNSEDIIVPNTIFSDALENILHESDFTDSTKTIFKNKSNTLYIRASINKLTFKDFHLFHGASRMVMVSGSIQMKSGSYYSSAEVEVKWEILDYYEQPRYTGVISSASGTFSPDYYESLANEEGEMGEGNLRLYQAAVEDALTTSFYELLAAEEVKELLEEEVNRTPEFDLINLTRSDQIIQNLGQSQEATVTISHDGGHGSGCAISKDGYIVTNYHVVAGQDELEVIANDGQKFPATLVRHNEFEDLALIKVEHEFPYAYLLFKDTEYAAGDEVFAVGTPNTIELGQTVSKGIISGIRKRGESEWLQTDVSVNPGNSGGALVTKEGKLLGIVNAKLMGFGVEGIGFAIPAREIQDLLKLSY